MHVNRQVPAGEASKLAFDETRVDWTTTTVSPLPGFDSRYAVSSRDNQADDLDENRGRGRRGHGKVKPRSRSRQGARPEVVSIFPGGARACRDYNKSKCRKGNKCQYEHSCWNKWAGKLCRASHPATRCKP